MMYSENQRKVLALLLKQYENSKTFLGENKVMQSFDISPEKVFEGYESDYEDINLVRDFEIQMVKLENSGLIVIKRGREVIEKLVANAERWPDYYKVLKKPDKRNLLGVQIELYKKYQGEAPILDGFCQDQINRLQANKKALYEMQDAEAILRFCNFILINREDILDGNRRKTGTGDC